ncbi:hypothetical protein [Oceanobacillus damuensis]|uniref:hypothetical protein n=1 Tax=Oceanobacillus damuensis TaxID=937928 RepID=UPI000AA87FBA|nr:hypothetical protein [Oceanobacillus damuensis]
MQPNNVKIKDAAKILGKSEQFIRVGLQENIFPFGYAVKMSSVWTYHISPKKLNEYVGMQSNDQYSENVI